MTKHDILRQPEGTISGILPAIAYPRGKALMVQGIDPDTGVRTFALATGRCDGFMTRASRVGPGLTAEEQAFGFNTEAGEPETPFEVSKPGSLELATEMEIEGGDYILLDESTDSDMVVSVTVSNAGTGFTSLPTVGFSGGAGSGAAAVARLKVLSLAIAGGGTGYTVGDVLTVVGGDNTVVATLTVSTVNTGVITGATVTTAGTYSAIPANAVAVTGGPGTGATFNLTWGVGSVVITSPGDDYTSAPTVAFSGGGGNSAAATAALGALTSGAITDVTPLFTPCSFVNGMARVAQSNDFAQFRIIGFPTPTEEGQLRVRLEAIAGYKVA